MFNLVQLTASPFFGGPEKQILGLAQALPEGFRTTFLGFLERGLARPFLDRCAAAGFETVPLKQNAPWIFAAAREVAGHLRRVRADIVVTNGYKCDLVGWLAGRQVGIPSVAVAHGWTSATWKVRLNEAIDRWVMRRMDAVVAVSEAMAEKVRRAGVRADRLVAIPNGIRAEDFAQPDPGARAMVEGFFPTAPRIIVAAAGRLSPEKGFDLYLEAAARLASEHPEVGFVLYGDGPLREKLASQLANLPTLAGRFVMAGFRTDLDRLMPAADLVVLSSHTEGLPVVVLEALASGVAVVATKVGGVPEVISDGEHGLLVPPGDAVKLARGIDHLLRDPGLRERLARAGKQRVVTEFSFRVMAQRYQALFERLTGKSTTQTAVQRVP